jgi:hypothetical protein
MQQKFLWEGENRSANCSVMVNRSFPCVLPCLFERFWSSDLLSEKIARPPALSPRAKFESCQILLWQKIPHSYNDADAHQTRAVLLISLALNSHLSTINITQVQGLT